MPVFLLLYTLNHVICNLLSLASFTHCRDSSTLLLVVVVFSFSLLFNILIVRLYHSVSSIFPGGFSGSFCVELIWWMPLYTFFSLSFGKHILYVFHWVIGFVFAQLQQVSNAFPKGVYHQHCMKVLIAPHSHQYLVFSVSFISDILVGV